jgi:hypothetical protein
MVAFASRAGAQPSAAEQDVSDAHYASLVTNAVKAFDAGRYLESREFLGQAHALRPNARTLRGMGLAAFEAGRYALAVVDLEAALAETRQPMSADQRAEVQKLQAEANALTARYRVTGRPGKADLDVDGQPAVWDSEGALLIESGAHTVSLKTGGGDIQSWSVRAQGGERADLDLAGALPPPSEPLPVRPSPELESPAAETVPLPAEAAATVETRARVVPDAVVYAAFGGAALTATLAVWQWGERESEVDDWNSDRCLERGRRRRDNCAEHQRAYERAETWAWVAGGATLVLSAGAVTLLLLNDNAEERPPSAARPICLPGIAALACRVSF